jgi:hypothetical protein
LKCNELLINNLTEEFFVGKMDILTTAGFGLSLAAVGIAGLMIPFLRYVVTGWEAKRKDVMDGLTTEALNAYFETFDRSGATSSAAKKTERFEQLYLKWYGRRFFLVPGLLLSFVTLIVVTLADFTNLDKLGYKILSLPNTAIAAIAGAYLWVVDDFISRARRLDFSPADVQWGVLRLIIAVPMGYAFASMATGLTIGPFIAFSLGAFPLSTLNSMLQRLANKKLGLEQTTDEASDDIVKLQGINKAIAERLANEDITTITQMAYCDPVDLVLRSNLSFNFVIDCMNQALAWMSIKSGLDTIRPLGLGGAVEIKNLIEAYDNNDPKSQAAHDRAVAAFPKIASALNQDEATLQLTFRQISERLHTIFLSRVRDCT